MIKLLRLTFAVTVIIATLNGLVRLSSDKQEPPILVIFTNSDGTYCQQPCLFGVHPGETTMSNAMTLIEKHPFTRGFVKQTPYVENSQSSSPVTRFQGLGLDLFLYPDSDDRVSEIYLLNTYDSSYLHQWGQLGQIMAFLGPPDLAGPCGVSAISSLYRVQHLMFVHHRQSSYRLKADDPFLSVSASALIPSYSLSVMRPWKGFRSADCSSSD